MALYRSGNSNSNTNNHTNSNNGTAGNKQNGHYSYYDQYDNYHYKNKYMHLKRIIKDLLVENGALCDRVSRMQDDILIVNEEKRYLLDKLLEYEGSSLNTASLTMNSSADNHNKQRRSNHSNPRDRNPKSRRSRPTSKKARETPADNSFPIYLGTLTIHSMGDTSNEKVTYHSEDVIYPIGFISTRVFASTKDPTKKCVYTCKITDRGNSPLFEITGDPETESPISGSSPDYCHEILLQRINSKLETRKIVNSSNGAKFFGLSHPVVLRMNQNLFSQKQKNSVRIKREEDDETDPSIYFDAFLKHIQPVAFHYFKDVKEEPLDT